MTTERDTIGCTAINTYDAMQTIPDEDTLEEEDEKQVVSIRTLYHMDGGEATPQARLSD